MLPKPSVPLTPVTVKDTTVETADSSVVIAALEICDPFMFPLTARSTVEPLLVVAFIVLEIGVGEGVGVGVAFGAGLGVGDGVGCAGVGEGVGLGEGDGEGEGDVLSFGS